MEKGDGMGEEKQRRDAGKKNMKRLLPAWVFLEGCCSASFR